MMIHMTTTDIHHAILRQQPKEAIIKEYKLWLEECKECLYDYEVHCPVCGMFICYTTEYNAHKDYGYCNRCGQKIYWNDDDNKEELND